MPEVRHTFTAKSPLYLTWDYVQSIGNWAPLLPGYQSHKELSDTDSIWTLVVDLGPFTRMMEMEAHVTERVAPEKVAFTVRSLNEAMTAKGLFQAAAGADGISTLTLNLSVDGTGPMAKSIGLMAKPVLDRMARNFARKLTARLEQRASDKGLGPGLPVGERP